MLKQGTGKILLVVQVKRSLMEKSAMWQMLSELAIAARHNQGVAVGTLTNIDRWVFFQVTAALQGEEGFDVKMSAQQQSEMNPVGVRDLTVKVLAFMCQSLFPERGSLSQADVSKALAAMDSRSHHVVQQAFDRYLSQAKRTRLLDENTRLRQTIAELE